MKSIKINWREGYIEEYKGNNYEPNFYDTICKASSRNSFCILKQKYKTSNCLWDAIAVDQSYFKLYTISHFTEWENLKINPYYEPFKRIRYFKVSSSGDKNWKLNVILISDISLHIETFEISNDDLEELWKLCSDKLINLKTSNLVLSSKNYIDIHNEITQILNKMDLNVLKFKYLNSTIDNFQELFLLNCAHIDVKFYYLESGLFTLTFSNVKILICSSDLNQKLTIKCDLATFFVRTQYFDNLILTNSGSNSCLFLPFEWISELKVSGFKIIQSSLKLNEQLSKLESQGHKKYNAFLIPIKGIAKTWIHFDNKNCFADYSTNVKVFSQILKAKDTNLTLNWLDDLLGIKLCVPSHYNLINYSIWNIDKKLIKRSSSYDKIQNFDLDQLSVLSIVIEHKIQQKS